MHIFIHIIIHILTGGGNNWIECVHIFMHIHFEHSGLHRVEPEHTLSLSGRH